MQTLAAVAIAAGCASSRTTERDPGVNNTQPTAAEHTPAAAGGADAARRVTATAQALLERALADSAFPGAFAVVGRRDGVLARVAVGRIDWDPAAPAPDERTLWDIASLTKVVGMTTAMMQLVDAGRVSLDAPVQRYLPHWTGPNKDRVRVRDLLTHSSGLPAWRPLYKEAASAESALALVYATPLDTLPGVRMVYSDLGAILLGEIVARVSGEPLADYLARHVFGPLGMQETMYRPDISLRPRIAPTEREPWRQRHLRGEVHDENAFALGGIAGHAGLFSTGRDLARFARMLLGDGALDGVQVVREPTLRLFSTRQDPVLSHRGLGWETSTGSNSGGHRLSGRAFGHTGFTGTSIWIDPAKDVFIVLLTNRVNPTRENPRISAVRVALADSVVSALAPGGVPSTARPE